MSLTVDFTPSEEARLPEAARREGVEPAELLRKLVADHLPLPMPVEEDPLLALLAQWDEEDTAMTPDEVAREKRDWEEFKANINAERDRAGSRRVF